MTDEIRLLCIKCIADYAERKRENVLPAVVVWEGKSLCWFHTTEFAGLERDLHVEYDKTTYPPSYEITRKKG